MQSLLNLLNEKRDTQLAWAGGIFEGEGCFSINHQKRDDGSFRYVARASVWQKERPILDIFRWIVGCGKIYMDKSGFHWQTTRKGETQFVVSLLRRFLSSRRNLRAQEVIHMEESCILKKAWRRKI